MNRILLKIGIAAVTLSLGVAVTIIYRLNSLQEVTMPEIKLEVPPTPSSYFPGLSVRIEKPTSASKYFPPFRSGSAWADKVRPDWYSKHLRAMNEHAVTSLKEEETYRFLWLRSFHHPVAIHVARSGTKKFITAKQTSGAGGYEPGTLEINHTRPLSDDEWNEFMMVLEHTRYWQMPTDEGEPGLDGARWILEGYREGRYHLVDRWTPQSGAYHEACLYLLKVSGLTRVTRQQEIY
jgi:hypothetical protein